MDSSVNLLRGRVYEAMDNRGLAAECFREALRTDVMNYEAFDCLVNHHMLSAQEGKNRMLSAQEGKTGLNGEYLRKELFGKGELIEARVEIKFRKIC